MLKDKFNKIKKVIEKNKLLKSFKGRLIYILKQLDQRFKIIKSWGLKNRKHQFLGTIFILMILLPIASILMFLFTKPVQADWFNANWSFRKRIDIVNSSGTTLTNFQVKFSIDTASLYSTGKLRSDCGDIRITDNQGKILPYWIETSNVACNANSSQTIWTKIDSIPSSGANNVKYIYLYYGNPLATSTQNGNDTFDFFDDFSSSTLNSNKWTATGAYSISSGALTITTGSVYSNNTIVSSNQNEMFEMRAKWATTQTSYSGIMISNANSIQGGNAGSNKLSMLMTNAGVGIDQQAFAADGTSATYNIVNNITQFTPTANTYYFSGFSHTTSNLRYYQNRSQTNSYSDTANFSPYLFLGYFAGSTAGTRRYNRYNY